MFDSRLVSRETRRYFEFLYPVSRQIPMRYLDSQKRRNNKIMHHFTNAFKKVMNLS